MPTYRAPVQDTLFVLERRARLRALRQPRRLRRRHAGRAGSDPQRRRQARRERSIQPTNRDGDIEGCTRHDDGSVTTPKGFSEAYRPATARAAGSGSPRRPSMAARACPMRVHLRSASISSSANMALMMYPGLTQGAIAAHPRPRHATSRRRPGCRRLVDGDWTGTMNLTEPHCGTDLGLLRTKAVPERRRHLQDLRPEDLHLRRRARPGREHRPPGAGPHRGRAGGHQGHLALHRAEVQARRRPAMPASATRVVLRLDRGEDGHPRQRHLRHELRRGARATCSARQNGGLRAMFMMMNEARLGVGMQGLAVGEAAYQNAAAYAGSGCRAARCPAPKAPDRPADPIIVHPDIRRKLMTMRAVQRGRPGARCCGRRCRPTSRIAPADEAERQAADDHLGLMTPVHQGRADRQGLRARGDGAAGVRRPRLHRRARHEPVRARRPYRHDLRGRQRHPGARPGRPQAADERRPRACRPSSRRSATSARPTAPTSAWRRSPRRSKKGLNDLQAATVWLMQNGLAKPDNAGAASTDYMHLFGLVALGYMWGLMVKAARGAPRRRRRFQRPLL